MSLHDRATTIIAELITKIGPLDPNTEAETIEAIKKLALDTYQHGRNKAESWNAVTGEAETTNPDDMASAALTRTHALLAQTIARKQAAEAERPENPYEVGLVTFLMPRNITNEVHRIAIGFFATLLWCRCWHSSAGFTWLESAFGQPGTDAGFYVFDLQESYSRIPSEIEENDNDTLPAQLLTAIVVENKL